MPKGLYYVGLMSGTSADAVDAVLVDNSHIPHLIACISQAIPSELRQRIHALCLPGNNEIDRMGNLDIELGLLFADTVIKLLDKANCESQDVVAIGSHGQTIRHRPYRETPANHPFSLQIGDPNTIAHMTGITTIADFRRRDVAAGGQGAPLVPAFHNAIFHSSEKDRVVINIGGMANITWLPKHGNVCGFDTGPGNVLLDGWIGLHQGKPFDADGQWAKSGTPHPVLLEKLLSHSFFNLPSPKSTGREDFNMDWLLSCLGQMTETIPPADVQATLLQLTAQSIAREILALSEPPKELILCGGGAYNGALLDALERALPNDRIYSSNHFNIAPEWIEAMAFAWLAQQTLAHKPGNLSTVTGAKQEVVLGGIYYT